MKRLVVCCVALALCGVAVALWFYVEWKREEAVVQSFTCDTVEVTKERVVTSRLRAMFGRTGFIFDRVRKIRLVGHISERDLSRLGSLSFVDELIIDSNDITDDSMLSFSKLHQLKFLSLRTTSADGSGLVHLSGLPHLQELLFWGKSTDGVGSFSSAGALTKVYLFFPTGKAGVASLIRNNPSLRDVGFLRVPDCDGLSSNDLDELRHEFPKVAFDVFFRD